MPQSQKLTTADLNTRHGGLVRHAAIRSIDAEKRTVELAFSSEAEVKRWFGIEILDHTPGAMRDGRLRDGAAVLVNHDWDDQVGVVESISVDADRRGRAVVRFGNGVRASEIWQDVVDGIRRHVSVGYTVHGIKLVEERDGTDVYRINDWEPFEISLVAVPADPSVGVGRGMEKPPEERTPPPADTDANIFKEGLRMDEDLKNPGAQIEPQPVNKTDERRVGADAERARTRTILEMGEQYGAAELAASFVKDGKSAGDFQRALLEHVNKRSSRPLSEQTADANIGLTDKEASQFSFMRAITALSNPQDRRAQEDAAFEFEASHAAAARAGKQSQGILIPADVLSRKFNTSKTGTAAGDTGGFSIATDLQSQSFIDMLRNRNTIMRLATPMGGLVGNVDIPRQVSGASGYWVGEDADVGEGLADLDQISLTPKTVGAFTEITRKLLQQSSLDVEALVRRDLASALATSIDYAGFYGTGSSNQPRGIANYSGINGAPFAAASPTYAELVALETEIAADNADVNSMAYVINARMRGHAKTTPKFSGDASAGVIWETGGTLNGYRAEVTNQIANGDVFFGNFADLIIGMWGGLDLTVDPYSGSKAGRLRIVVFQDVDFVLRRVESFALGRETE